jgi:putative hemolysin
VQRLLEQPSELLGIIVLGNTIANSALVALVLWPALNGRLPVAAAVAGVALLILLGCEVLPKALAIRSPEPWALRVAPPMATLLNLAGWLERLLRRLNEWLLRVLVRTRITPLPNLADEEYAELVELAAQQGALALSEKEIILQILSLDRKTVRDVMRPRSQMAAIPDDLSIEEMVQAARASRHRRLPIYDETPDTIVGVLDTQVLLLDPAANFEDAMEFPSFVPETMNLLQLLKSFERQRRGLAIVRDEFGGTAGLVTVADILGEVVGRMPGDQEGAHHFIEALGPGRWRVAGRTPVGEFRRECPALGEVSHVDTMGGLLVALLEVVPATGESAVFRGLRLTAQAVEARRVKEVLVEQLGRKA